MIPEKLKLFQAATYQSTCLLTLHCIKWLARHKKRLSSVKLYWEFRDELAYDDQLLFKSNQVIVSELLRSEIVNKIHESHQVVVKSKQRVKDILFWSGMNVQIQEAVEKYATYTKFRRGNQKEPLMFHEIPNYHWSEDRC